VTEVLLRVKDVELCAETFGAASDPTILLIAGAAASMDWWDAAFCRRLAAGGRFVIRYDHRDTGRSTTCPPGAPDYTGFDLADDPIGVLDALGIGPAHLVGMSMGGGIAQQLAIEVPDRVLTLTLMSTSSAGPGSAENGLPPMAEALRAAFAEPAAEPDWNDRDAVIEHLVAAERLFSAPQSFDPADARAVAARMVDRSVNPASSQNHWQVEGGPSPRSRLSEVTAPTLVVHGTEDPFFPPGHGVALSREIPGAQLLLLDGVGHQAPPRSSWDVVVDAVLRHTATGVRPGPRRCRS
jgi:pimeloyl-ACP methyl ester carboxylesterase